MTDSSKDKQLGLVQNARVALSNNGPNVESGAEDFASVPTFRSFRRRGGEQARRGRKPSNVWKCKLYLFQNNNAKVMPSYTSEYHQYLVKNGYGPPKSVDCTGQLEVNRKWTIEELKTFLCKQYPQMSLEDVGFNFAKCDKGKKIVLLKPSSITSLENSVARGRLLLIPQTYLDFIPPKMLERNFSPKKKPQRKRQRAPSPSESEKEEYTKRLKKEMSRDKLKRKSDEESSSEDQRVRSPGMYDSGGDTPQLVEDESEGEEYVQQGQRSRKKKRKKHNHHKYINTENNPEVSVFKPEELCQKLMPSLKKLYDPDTRLIENTTKVKTQMDRSTIKQKLDTTQYQDPWQYVNDVYLMFENAWPFNMKTSKINKNCTKLKEIFEAEIDPIMQELGYCCGRKYVFQPQVLCCFGKQLCTIPRDATYHSYQNRYHFCEECFAEIEGEYVSLADDGTAPAMSIKKENLNKMVNNVLEPEKFVECLECGRKLHQICVLHLDAIWTEGFTCDGCRKEKGLKKRENKFTAKELQTTKLDIHLEKRVNKYLMANNAGAGHVHIRVVSSSDKVVEVKSGMKSRFGEFPLSFPYRAKTIFAFEEIGGVDVCFFGMHVQEYGSDCLQPNTSRVYISYLDSVRFFQPSSFRTAVYHEILIGYLEYMKILGYSWAHIWACPPSIKGDDYIFHCHPVEQKIPNPGRLRKWYQEMVDKAVKEKIITNYQDIDENITSAAELPYFEGDFWPNFLEESIKKLDQEEKERQKAEKAAAIAEQEVANGRKKRSSTQRKNNKKTNLLQGGNDLSNKLYATMKKKKKAFFVMCLNPEAHDQPISDPDHHISCDLMDGRDAFLTMAEEKHFEFSSLRRAKFSSMAMVFELHKQGQEQPQMQPQQMNNQVPKDFELHTLLKTIKNGQKTEAVQILRTNERLLNLFIRWSIWKKNLKQQLVVTEQQQRQRHPNALTVAEAGPSQQVMSGQGPGHVLYRCS